MFKNDQKQIEEFASKSPENTARVIEFVLISIRRNFANVEDIMTKRCEVGLMGITSKGIDYAYDNAIALHALINDPNMTVRDKLLGVCQVPGLGVPKAGFVLQLCLGKAGCLDTHNLRNFNLQASDFKLTNNLAKNIVIAQTYLDVCEKLGGCEVLWDQWCDFIAERWAYKWPSSEDVSNAHVRGIVF